MVSQKGNIRCSSLPQSLAMLILRILFLLLLSAAAGAHELRPPVVTIDLTESPRLEIEVKANLEAILAGIGTAHKDTEDAPEAESYRALRAQSPNDLDKTAHARLADLADDIRLRFDDGAATLSLQSVEIPDDPDTNRARTSIIRFRTELPAGAQSLHWAWPSHLGDSVLRVRLPDQEGLQTAWLRAGEQSEPIALRGIAEPSTGETFERYLVLGFTHIVPLGIDHILFVLGLFLLSTHWRPLLYQVTAFTLAHTLTLGLSIYGIFSLPGSIVEPLIAASIVFIALENVLSAQLHPWRVAVVFVFGLLHGLGFAGVLGELGMPASQFLTALLSFNIGVELGQLAVIAGAFLLVLPWMRRPGYRRLIVIPASLAIAAVGAWWTVERVFL